MVTIIGDFVGGDEISQTITMGNKGDTFTKNLVFENPENRREK